MRLPYALVAVGFCATTLIGCGDAADDFDPKTLAEDGIAEQILVELELHSDVTCVAPTSLAVGTEFECDADADDDTSYHFIAVILEDQIIGTKLD